jgi:hypothetical protein
MRNQGHAVSGLEPFSQNTLRDIRSELLDVGAGYKHWLACLYRPASRRTLYRNRKAFLK